MRTLAPLRSSNRACRNKPAKPRTDAAISSTEANNVGGGRAIYRRTSDGAPKQACPPVYHMPIDVDRKFCDRSHTSPRRVLGIIVWENQGDLICVLSGSCLAPPKRIRPSRNCCLYLQTNALINGSAWPYYSPIVIVRILTQAHPFLSRKSR